MTEYRKHVRSLLQSLAEKAENNRFEQCLNATEIPGKFVP